MGDVATDVDGGRRYQHQPAAASWPDGDTGDIQPPGSGGGAASGTPHTATPALGLQQCSREIYLLYTYLL